MLVVRIVVINLKSSSPGRGTCTACGQITFLNPVPVSVVLTPVDGGLLAIRRALEPHKGMLALPGGYINLGESWREAGAREVYEETGLTLVPDDIDLFDVRDAPDGTLLIFGLVAPQAMSDLTRYLPNEESSELVVIRAATQLAFWLHADVAAKYFSQKGYA